MYVLINSLFFFPSTRLLSENKTDATPIFFLISSLQHIQPALRLRFALKSSWNRDSVLPRHREVSERAQAKWWYSIHSTFIQPNTYTYILYILVLQIERRTKMPFVNKLRSYLQNTIFHSRVHSLGSKVRTEKWVEKKKQKRKRQVK